MLQQTQVATVVDYFNNFIISFPTIAVLANADEEEVLTSWAGLGYYSRARNLHKSAKIILSEYQGIFPTDYSQLIGLPGVGESTVLGLGKDYISGEYTDVPLVFANSALSRSDVVAAKASVSVDTANFDNSGNIGNITITSAGANYKADDILTIDPSAIAKVDAADSDTSPTLSMVYLNQTEVESYAQKRFFVAEADYPTVVTALGRVGGFFQNDAGGTNLIYISKDDDNFAFTYFVADTEGEDLTTSDTISGVAITSVDVYSPPGSVKPQYRFEDDQIDLDGQVVEKQI